MLAQNDLNRLHRLSFSNQLAVHKSNICGCFYCCKIFPANEITKFTGDNTALCPYCGIDSILPDTHERINLNILQEMFDCFFSVKEFNPSCSP